MRHYHRKSAQFELFEPSDIAKTMTMPDWQTLPFQVREVLTGLIARLLLEHGQEPARSAGQNLGEANDD